VLALGVAALAVVLPGVLVVGGWLALSGGVAWTADAWWRAATLAGVHVAYFAACATLGVIVSAACRTSRDATLVLVGIWLVLWVLVPRAVPAAASAAHGLPTRAAFEAEVERRTRALGDSHDPADEKFEAFKADVLARAGVSRVEDLPVNYNGVQMAEGERLTTEAYRGMRDALAAVRRDHERAASLAAVGAPVLAMRLVSMALAGADVAYVDDFERQAEDYRYALVQYLNRLHAEEVANAADRYVAASGSDAPTRQRIEASHWRETPVFAYVPLPMRRSLAQAWPAAAVLLVWTGALALVLWRLRPEVSA
jgi:ABC-2 type transport system permease protein